MLRPLFNETKCRPQNGLCGRLTVQDLETVVTETKVGKLISFVVLGSAASLSTVLLAAETEAKTFSDMAERWGLWAALTLVLIGAMMWALYKIVTFVLTTLVGLITRTEHTLARVADAMQDAPCGANWNKGVEQTQHGSRPRRASESPQG